MLVSHDARPAVLLLLSCRSAMKDEIRLALLAHSHDRARRPVFGAVLGAHAAGAEAQGVVVFLDGGQVRWDFELVGRSEAAEGARGKFPHEPLLVRHLLLAVVVGKNLHDGAVRVEECAVWNLRMGTREFYWKSSTKQSSANSPDTTSEVGWRSRRVRGSAERRHRASSQKRPFECTAWRAPAQRRGYSRSLRRKQGSPSSAPGRRGWWPTRRTRWGPARWPRCGRCGRRGGWRWGRWWASWWAGRPTCWRWSLPFFQHHVQYSRTVGSRKEPISTKLWHRTSEENYWKIPFDVSDHVWQMLFSFPFLSMLVATRCESSHNKKAKTYLRDGN